MVSVCKVVIKAKARATGCANVLSRKKEISTRTNPNVVNVQAARQKKKLSGKKTTCNDPCTTHGRCEKLAHRSIPV